jgi:hypothetical protein
MSGLSHNLRQDPLLVFCCQRARDMARLRRLLLAQFPFHQNKIKNREKTTVRVTVKYTLVLKPVPLRVRDVRATTREGRTPYVSF